MKKKSLVLIVDDNPQNLQVLGNILKENGYSPAVAQSGINAINFIKRKQPDLILLDIMMPEMDGFEVCQALQQDPRTQAVPIIFLTARTEKEDVVKGLALGAVDYVTKPFNAKELITRVNTHLELKATKEALEQKVEELKQANATKDKFFSIIAHDLAGYFNTLLSLSEFLGDKAVTVNENKREEYIESIYQSSMRGYNLLRNLLDWAKTQTGTMHFSPMKLNLKHLIQGNIDLLYNSAQMKYIEISEEVSETLFVFADKNMLDTVIRNLLSNAIKFTHEQGHIQFLSKTLPESFIEITVMDNGTGIKSENLDKLFQIDHTTPGTRQEKGTGLGLTLCKEFIEKNGGKIAVESQEGQGSCFSLILPAA